MRITNRTAASWLFGAAALTAWLAGCATAPPPSPAQGAVDHFPFKHIPLREGDIVLCFGSTLPSLLIARYGIPAGPYSHSGMYYHNEEGVGRILSMGPEGLESVHPLEFVNRYELAALVRMRGDADTQVLGETARELWEHNKADPVRFDHALIRKTDDSARLYCNELVSHVYGRSELPDPFAGPADVKETYWTERVLARTGIDLLSSVSPNAVLSSSEFEALAQIQKKERPERGEIITSAILDRIRFYAVEQHYEPRKPSLGSRLIIALEKAVLLRDYINELPNPEQRDVCYAMAEYVAQCSLRTLTLIAQNEGEDWPPEDVRELTERVCDAYRDRYFCPREELSEDATE